MKIIVFAIFQSFTEEDPLFWIIPVTKFQFQPHHAIIPIKGIILQNRQLLMMGTAVTGARFKK